jgi:hypothetical protein
VSGSDIADHALEGSAGPFWDTRTDSIIFSPGNTKVDLSILSGFAETIAPRPQSQDILRPADCMTWAAQVLSVPTKPAPVIIVPGTGASVLLTPGIPGNNGWPLDVLFGTGDPQNLQFMENALPRLDNVFSLLQPDCCLGGAAASAGGERVPK